MLEPETTEFLGKRTTMWVNEIFQKRNFEKPVYTLCRNPQRNKLFTELVVSNWDGHSFRILGPEANKATESHALVSTKFLGVVGITKIFLMELKSNLKPVWPKYPLESELNGSKQMASESETNVIANASGSSNDSDSEPVEFGKDEEIYRGKYGIVWLEEFTTKANIAKPKETTRQFENGFVSTLAVEWNGTKFTGSGAPTKKKKQARHSAALNLLTNFGFNKSNLYRIELSHFRYPDILCPQLLPEKPLEIEEPKMIKPKPEPETNADEALELEKLEDEVGDLLNLDDSISTAPKDKEFTSILEEYRQVSKVLTHSSLLNQMLSDKSILMKDTSDALLKVLVGELKEYDTKIKIYGTQYFPKKEDSGTGTSNWAIVQTIDIPWTSGWGELKVSKLSAIGFGITEKKAVQSGAMKLFDTILKYYETYIKYENAGALMKSLPAQILELKVDKNNQMEMDIPQINQPSIGKYLATIHAIQIDKN